MMVYLLYSAQTAVSAGIAPLKVYVRMHISVICRLFNLFILLFCLLDCAYSVAGFSAFSLFELWWIAVSLYGVTGNRICKVMMII